MRPFAKTFPASARYTVTSILFVALCGVTLVAILGLPACSKKQPEPEEIKIGAILPLTGDLAAHGEDGKRGIALAAKIRNEDGGIGGKKVRVVYEDDRNNPIDGVSAFKRLVETEGIEAIVGGMSSTVALAIAPIAEEKKVVFFSPTASHPRLTIGRRYVFRNWPNDDCDAKIIADFARGTLNIARFVILYVNNDNGHALSTLFERRIRETGGIVALNEPYEAGTADFRTVLTRVKNLTPEAVYLPGSYEDVARILVQAREMGLGPKFMCSSAVENPRLIELARNAAEGVLYSKTVVDPNDENYKRFAERFEKDYSSMPGIAASQCFDAVNLILVAIEKGGNEGAKIREELHSIRDYPGVTGNTSFDANGDVVKGFAIYTVRNGQFVKYY